MTQKRYIRDGARFGTVGTDKFASLSAEIISGTNMMTITSTKSRLEFMYSIELLVPESKERIVFRAQTNVFTVEEGAALGTAYKILLYCILLLTVRSVKTWLARQGCSSNTGGDVDDDLQIVENGAKLSTRCPISLQRIQTPARGVQCTHVQVVHNKFLLK